MGNFFNKSRNSRAWRLFALFLAVVIVFSTTYSMVLPAIAMSDEEAEQEPGIEVGTEPTPEPTPDRKSTRLNSSHSV